MRIDNHRAPALKHQEAIFQVEPTHDLKRSWITSTDPEWPSSAAEVLVPQMNHINRQFPPHPELGLHTNVPRKHTLSIPNSPSTHPLIMAAYKRVALILGAGSNIGEAVANKFEAAGYRVAVASRRYKDQQLSPERWSYNVDLSRPEEVAGVFSKVSRDIEAPSVVIYNGRLASQPAPLFLLT